MSERDQDSVTDDYKRGDRYLVKVGKVVHWHEFIRVVRRGGETTWI